MISLLKAKTNHRLSHYTATLHENLGVGPDGSKGRPLGASGRLESNNIITVSHYDFRHRYITSDLHVICHSLKEYNAYRNFLEFEFMKLRKQQEDEVKERERKASQTENNNIITITQTKHYIVLL